MFDKLFRLMKSRRSVRKYTGEKVDRAEIEKIIKSALTAPSSYGKHPIEFVVLDDKELIKAVARCKTMGAGPLPYSEYAIVVMGDTEACDLWIEDCSVASTHILLAAEALGLGACWIHIRGRKGKVLSTSREIKQLLHIPQKYEILNIVAIGQKGEEKPARDDSELHYENVHYNNFGTKF